MECLTVHPEFPSGGVEGRQLQQHRQMANALIVVQSLANALGKCQHVVDIITICLPHIQLFNSLQSGVSLEGALETQPTKVTGNLLVTLVLCLPVFSAALNTNDTFLFHDHFSEEANWAFWFSFCTSNCSFSVFITDC